MEFLCAQVATTKKPIVLITNRVLFMVSLKYWVFRALDALALERELQTTSRTQFIRTRTNFRFQETVMTRKILILTMLFVTTFFTLPSDATAQGKSKWGKSDNWSQGRWDNKRGRRRYQGRNRIYYGYRNYGQYRRTQVGNRRRYRLVRRYYWDDGMRLARWVRVYY